MTSAAIISPAVNSLLPLPAVLNLTDAVAWSPGYPFLYEIELTVVDRSGRVIDEVSSYSGLRKIHVEGSQLYLNNKPLFQRLVLDQGFYPDGIWIASGDEALKNDILLSMKAGFNGARLHIECYRICKDLDPTRPVNDTSGYIHHITDLWTVHNYEQDPGTLREMLTPDPEKGVWRNVPKHESEYDGQLYLVDEYGGIKWIPGEEKAYAENSWGYGDAPKTLEEFYARLKALTEVLLELPHISGYCYTQLTDVEQKQNGVYSYDRSEKFDMERIAAIFGRNS